MISGARTPLTVDLGGYRVAISAGANGIGKVMADSFSTCGASVFVSDVDERALAASGHPGVRADAGSPSDCEAFVDAFRPGCAVRPQRRRLDRVAGAG